MSVRVVEDRSLCIQPDQVVKSDWIDIDCCKLGLHSRMTPEAVEKKWRRLLQQGEAACWPPVVGHWEGERFVVCDGRHEYIAALMLGRTRTYVAWLEKREEYGQLRPVTAIAQGSPRD